MYSPNINAKCNLPSFMLETQEDAEMCGKFRGNIAATVFTIFTIIIFITIMYSVYDVTTQANKKIAKEIDGAINHKNITITEVKIYDK